MELKALQDFSWAHDHVRVVEYKTGDTIDTEDVDLITVAKHEGWAEEVGAEPKKDAGSAPVASRAKKVAPENKDAGSAPENK